MTEQRFNQFPAREAQVFESFLDAFDRMASFQGIKYALQDYEPHPGGVEDYDIRVAASSGPITFEIQESQDFSSYGDLRLDYVSAFTPMDYRCNSLQAFKADEQAGRVTVQKWGKVINPEADFLVVEFQNGQPQWQIYHLLTINELLPELESIGQFRTNFKFREAWGSAFLAVPETHPTLQRAKPQTLTEILTRTLNAREP